jgi:hypothetical protein
MKTTLIIIAIVLAIGLAAAGGFWGGMQYQSSLADQARADFESARGPLSGMPGGAIPSGQRPEGQFQGGGAPGVAVTRGGTAGSVKALQGDTLTLSTAQDVTSVKLSEDTVIQKTVTGSLEDLQTGVRVMVAGERNDDGSIDAAQITILPGDPIRTNP